MLLKNYVKLGLFWIMQNKGNSVFCRFYFTVIMLLKSAFNITGWAIVIFIILQAFEYISKIHFCGEGGIRTHDTLAGILPFQGSLFNHSSTSPEQNETRGYNPLFIICLRRARDSNPHRLAPGGFQDRCNTIMRALRLWKANITEWKFLYNVDKKCLFSDYFQSKECLNFDKSVTVLMGFLLCFTQI